MNKNIEKLTTCLACERKFEPSQFCYRCEQQDPHHQRKVPKGACQQCLEKGLSLTKVWNDKYYCSDCLQWNQEMRGIGNVCGHFLDSYCRNCGQCSSCLTRQELVGYSTRDLMLEVMNRTDYNALINWEDDSFKQRFQEIMWELEQVKGWTPEQIEIAVNKDIFEKKVSQRKFSRGT